jgi:hypothetical protein
MVAVQVLSRQAADRLKAVRLETSALEDVAYVLSAAVCQEL